MYPSCAGDIVTAASSGRFGCPLASTLVAGQMNRPRSSRFENRHAPCPSCQMIFTRSPRFPRKTKRCPACGSDLSVSCTISASPGKPRRMSVWPVASHTRTPAGTGITAGITDWLSERRECAPRRRRRHPRRRGLFGRFQERLQSGTRATTPVTIWTAHLLPPLAKLASASLSAQPAQTPGMACLLRRHPCATGTANSGQHRYCGRQPRR